MEILKNQISSVELHYLIKEFDILIDGKIDQIYQFDKKDFILQFHKTGVGKLKLRITVPNFIYITEYKPDATPPRGFCMTMRKHLKNSRLRSIKQMDFERILELEFETKEGKKYIYIELFSKGNMILTDEDMNILQVIEHQKWAERMVRPGVKYTYPKREHNILKISKPKLKEILTPQKETVVKILATDFGLGGIYAEEVLEKAKIEKNKKDLTDKEITSLNNELQNLKSRDINPKIIIKNGKVKDIIPFELDCYNEYEKEETQTYNQAFDKILTEGQKEETEKKSTSKYEIQLKKVKNMIKIQEKSVKKLQQTGEECQINGELIYNKYQIIDEILTEIKKAREKMSWKDIKEKLKGHKIIKEINEKTGKIIIEI